MTLKRIKLGRNYDCGGKRLENYAWIDPQAVVSVEAHFAGQSESDIFLSSGHKIRASGSPDEVVERLRA